VTLPLLGVTAAALLGLSAAACLHQVAVAPIAAHVVTWTIPLDATDDARVCVQTQLMAWVDPADVLPLRCVSVGTVRAWIRAQRMANE
jgi:hypothetical protein